VAAVANYVDQTVSGLSALSADSVTSTGAEERSLAAFGDAVGREVATAAGARTVTEGPRTT
jgi:hypothetical protein